MILPSTNWNFTIEQHFDGGAPIKIKEEPEDCGIRSIQKVPSLSDLSDPENSLGKWQSQLSILLPRNINVHAMACVRCKLILNSKMKMEDRKHWLIIEKWLLLIFIWNALRYVNLEFSSLWRIFHLHNHT